MAKGLDERVVLVAGGAGYVGSVLSRALLAAGYGVRVLDSLVYGNGGSIAELGDRERFSFVRGDIRSADDVDRSLEGVTDVVCLAAVVGDPACKRNPELARSVNVDGSSNLVDRCRGRGLGRFLFASTCSNYGLREDDVPASEDDELKPLSLYAETKVEMETRILERSSELDFEPTVLRVATAYGASSRMRFDLTVSEFTRELALGRRLQVYDPDTWRPYCHLLDIAEAVRLALEAPAKDVTAEVFNVGGPEANYTKRMIVEAVLEALDGNGEVEWVEGGVDPRNYRVGFEKIAGAIGFQPRYRVPASIRGLIAAVRGGLFEDVEQRPDYYGNSTLEVDQPAVRGAGDAAE